jgi:hypothetical protein
MKVFNFFCVIFCAFMHFMAMAQRLWRLTVKQTFSYAAFVFLALMLNMSSAQAQWLHDDFGLSTSGTVPTPYINTSLAANPTGIINQGLVITTNNTSNTGTRTFFPGWSGTAGSNTISGGAVTWNWDQVSMAPMLKPTEVNFTYTIQLATGASAQISSLSFGLRRGTSSLQNLSHVSINGNNYKGNTVVSNSTTQQLSNTSWQSAVCTLPTTLNFTSGQTITILIRMDTEASTNITSLVNRLDELKIFGTLTPPVTCTTPTAFNVTGGGAYCTGGTGVAIGLSNSETGVTYQLKKGGVDEEVAKAGTGSALTWANKTNGTYTVVATRTVGGCTATMTGSAVVTVNNCPTLTLGTATNPLFCGGITGTISFTSQWIAAGTQTITYQKDGNSASASVTVSLSNASDGTFTLSNLGAGLYSNFAIGMATATGNRNLNNPSPSLAFQSVLHVNTCGGSNGIIFLNTTNVLSGTYTLNYQKNGIAASASLVASNGDLDLINLSKGTYSNFSVMYGSCSTTYADGPIVVNDPAIATLSVTEIAPITYCNASDAQVSIIPSLSSENYSLSYKKNGVTQTPINIPDVGATINTFGAGNYTEMKITGVTTTCVSAPQAITINNLTTSLDFWGTIDPTTCGGTDGTIGFFGMNMDPTPCVFSYKKNGIAQSVTVSPIGAFYLTNLSAGLYTDFAVQLADAGCIPTYSGLDVDLFNPVLPTFTVGTTVLPTSCNTTDGSIELIDLLTSEPYTVSYVKNGGTPVVAPYTSDSNGKITLTGLAVGNYTNIKVTELSTTCTSTTASVPLTLPTLTATVTMSAMLNANSTSGIFTATPGNNAGATPSYQWKKGTNNVGTNSSTYTDAALALNDAISCVMTSSLSCASTATSNTVTITTCNCDPMCSALETTVGEPKVGLARFDGNYTHYCTSDNKLLLSLIIPSGTIILPGSVNTQIGATPVTTYSQYCGATAPANLCFMNATNGALINRFWYIDAAFPGNVNGITTAVAKQLTVVSYFANTDYTSLNTATNNGVPNVTDIKLYYPKASYSFGKFPSTSDVKPNTSVLPHSNGANASTSFWKLSSYQNNTIHAAEFKVGNIKNTGGLGKFQ